MSRVFLLLLPMLAVFGVLVYSVGPCAATESRLTPQALKNAEYRSEQYGDTWIRLKNGNHEERTEPDGTLEFVLKLSYKMAFGDLNNDDRQDAAVILISSGGGSGSFRELIAVLDKNGSPRQAAVQFMGDRTDIKSIAIRSGVIYVDLVRHGPNDPMCCPTVREVKKYRLEGGKLVVIP